MRFVELDRHAEWLVPTERENIRRFIDGLNYGLRLIIARELATDAKFDRVVEIARRLEIVCRQEHEEREAKRLHSSGGFSSATSGGQSHYSRVRSSRPVQATRHIPRSSLVSHSSYSAHPPQSSFCALPAPSSYCAPSAQVSTGSSLGYQGQQPVKRGCYECGDLSHLKRDCPRLLRRVP
ncbi:uncharacterized protein [Nicotiana tomentosiformis]|uniref:uncharacterized protein n=1 Tax=Nicotiana tomentosiformis TaxID=4098 RepID=UPI00388CBF4D